MPKPMKNITAFLNPRNSFYLAVVALLDIALCYLVVIKDAATIYRENGWMENMQVGFLAIACVLFFVTALRLESRHRMVCFFFAMLSFIFMFREVDVDKFDVPQFLIFMLAEQGRSFFFIILLGILGWEIKNFSHYWRNKSIYMASSSFIYITVAALLLIIFSHAFDRKLIMIEHRVFFEELAEMTSYLMILGAGLFAYKDLNAVTAQIETATASANS